MQAASMTDHAAQGGPRHLLAALLDRALQIVLVAQQRLAALAAGTGAAEGAARPDASGAAAAAAAPAGRIRGGITPLVTLMQQKRRACNHARLGCAHAPGTAAPCFLHTRSTAMVRITAASALLTSSLGSLVWQLHFALLALPAAAMLPWGALAGDWPADPCPPAAAVAEPAPRSPPSGGGDGDAAAGAGAVVAAPDSAASMDAAPSAAAIPHRPSTPCDTAAAPDAPPARSPSPPPPVAPPGSQSATAPAAAPPPAQGPPAARRFSYRSPVTQRATVMVKALTRDDGDDGAPATRALARRLPQAVLAAASAQPAASGAPAGQAPPAMLAFVGFSGCYCGVADVAWPAGDELPEGAALAAAVQQQLEGLEGVRVVCAHVMPLAQQAAAALGAACDPACLPSSPGASSPVTVTLPTQLAARLSGEGRGLRVIVSSPALHAPVRDVTVRPGGAAWPADGRVQLVVPCDAGALLTVTLLSCPPPPPEGVPPTHAADEYLTSLPLLVLPEAARREVEVLWQGMVGNAWGGGAADAAAAQAFAVDFLPWAIDLGTLLSHGCEGLLLPVAEAMLAFLRQQGLHECERLLLQRCAPQLEQHQHQPPLLPPPPAAAPLAAGAGSVADAGPSAGEGATAAPPPPAAAGVRRDAFHGHGGGGGGGAPPRPAAPSSTISGPPDFPQWLSDELVSADAWFAVMCLVHATMVTLVTAAHGGGAALLAFNTCHTALLTVPAAVRLRARRAYARHRSAIFFAHKLLHTLFMVGVPLLCLPAEDVALFYSLHRRGAWPIAVVMCVVAPLLAPLPALVVLVQIAPLLVDVHTVHVRSTGAASMPLLAYVALPLVCVLANGAGLLSLRRRWQVLARGRTAPRRGGAGSPSRGAASAGGGDATRGAAARAGGTRAAAVGK